MCSQVVCLRSSVKDVRSHLLFALYQEPAFCFHENRGEDIVLSNNQQTAERKGEHDLRGNVMACDPMKVNNLYEVRSCLVTPSRSTICIRGNVMSCDPMKVHK